MKPQTLKKLKVATIVGTRPEIIRLSRVMAELEVQFDHVLIHTGQNYDYELNEIFFKDLGIKKPDHFLDAAGKTPAETIGNVIAKVDSVLEVSKPDAVLILGDTNSALAALSAKRRKIPVFHMEAGNRCFDQRVPEEINRKIVDHISDINLPYSDIAREYLLTEGLPADRVIKTGSPMFEVIQHYLPQIQASAVLNALKLKKGDYFVLSCHREENVDDPKQLKNLIATLDAITRTYSKKIIFSAHPRTRKRLEESGHTLPAQVEMLKPLGFFDFVNLQINAAATLSDSGTITEEASILNFAALNIRASHERPEGMEEASVILTGLSPERVLQGLSLVLSQKTGEKREFLPVKDYQAPNVSKKVARIILSYVDYINHHVWKK